MTTPNALVTDPSLQSVLTAASLARTQSLAILDFLSAHHDTSPSSNTSSDSQQEQQLALSAHQKLLTTHLAHLRNLNRRAVLGVRATKHETGEARQEIDALHLQLQNLYYEQRHLRGEIAGCEGYEHIYTSLPLTSPEEFLASHPEHLESSNNSALSEHDLTILRIQDEHAARQALEEQRQALQKRKEALVKEANAKKEELGKLDAEVEKWVSGEAGVRKVFEARERKIGKSGEKKGVAAAS